MLIDVSPRPTRPPQGRLGRAERKEEKERESRNGDFIEGVSEARHTGGIPVEAGKAAEMGVESDAVG